MLELQGLLLQIYFLHLLSFYTITFHFTLTKSEIEFEQITLFQKIFTNLCKCLKKYSRFHRKSFSEQQIFFHLRIAF